MFNKASEIQGNRFTSLSITYPEYKHFIDNLYRHREHFINAPRKILSHIQQAVQETCSSRVVEHDISDWKLDHNAENFLGYYTMELIVRLSIQTASFSCIDNLEADFIEGVFWLPQKILPNIDQLKEFQTLNDKAKKKILVLNPERFYMIVKELQPRMNISQAMYALFIVEKIIEKIIKTAIQYENGSNSSGNIRLSTIETLLNLYKEKTTQKLKKANTTEINLNFQNYDYEKCMTEMHVFLTNMIDQMELIFRLLKCPLQFLVNPNVSESGEGEDSFLPSILLKHHHHHHGQEAAFIDRSHRIVVTYSLLNELYQGLRQILTTFEEIKEPTSKTPLERIGSTLLELAESNVLHLFSCYSATLLQRPHDDECRRSFKEESTSKSSNDILEMETLSEMSFDCTIFLCFMSRYILSTLTIPTSSNVSDSGLFNQTHSFTCPDCLIWENYIQDGDSSRIEEKFLTSVVKELHKKLSTQSQSSIINLFNSTNCNFLVNTFKYLLPRLLLIPIFHFFCLYEMIENLLKICSNKEEKSCLKEVLSILRRTKRELKTDLTQNNWVGIYLSRLVITGYLNCSTEPLILNKRNPNLFDGHFNSLNSDLDVLIGEKDLFSENVIPASLFLAAAREIGMICPEARRFYHSACNVTPNAPAFILGFTGPTSSMLNMVTSNSSQSISCPSNIANPLPFVAGIATNSSINSCQVIPHSSNVIANQGAPGEGKTQTSGSGESSNVASNSIFSANSSNILTAACPLSAFLHRTEEIDRMLIGKERIFGHGSINNAQCLNSLSHSLANLSIGQCSLPNNTPVCEDCYKKHSVHDNVRYPLLGNFILEGKLFIRDSTKRGWSDRFVILFSQYILICKWQPNRRSPLIGQQGLKIKQKYSLKNGFHVIDIPSKADWLRFSNSLNLSSPLKNTHTGMNHQSISKSDVEINTNPTVDCEEETLCHKNSILESLSNDTPTSHVFRLEIQEPADFGPSASMSSQSPTIINQSSSHSGSHFDFDQPPNGSACPRTNNFNQPLTLIFAAEHLESKVDWISSLLALQTNEFLNYYTKIIPKLSSPKFFPNEYQYEFAKYDSSECIVYDKQENATKKPLSTQPRGTPPSQTSANGATQPATLSNLQHAHIKSFDLSTSQTPSESHHASTSQRKHKSNPSIMSTELLNRLDENQLNAPPVDHVSRNLLNGSNLKISYATLPKIIEKITSSTINYDLNLVNMFLLTFRRFITQEAFLDLLIKRYIIPNYEEVSKARDPNDEECSIREAENAKNYNRNFKKSIQLKVVYVMYKWACNSRYYKCDFLDRPALRQTLMNFLINDIIKPAQKLDKSYLIFNREYKALANVAIHIIDFLNGNHKHAHCMPMSNSSNPKLMNMYEIATERTSKPSYNNRSRSFENLTLNMRNSSLQDISHKAMNAPEFSTPVQTEGFSKKKKLMCHELHNYSSYGSMEENEQYEVKLTNIHPYELAQQITLHEWNIYKKIEFWEIDGRDKGKGETTDQMTPNLRRSIDFSNALRNWLVYSILKERTQEDRVVIVQRIIDLMLIMNKLRNEQGSQEAKSVLISASVFRLKKTFQSVKRSKYYREAVEKIRSNDNTVCNNELLNPLFNSQQQSSTSSPNSMLISSNLWKSRASMSTNSSTASNACYLNIDNLDSNASSNTSTSSLTQIRNSRPSSFDKFMRMIETSQWNSHKTNSTKERMNSINANPKQPHVPFLAKGLKTRLIHLELKYSDSKTSSNGETMINVGKLRAIYELVENYLRYQNIPYQIEPIKKIQNFLSNLSQFESTNCTDQESFEQLLYQLSESYEPREALNSVSGTNLASNIPTASTSGHSSIDNTFNASSVNIQSSSCSTSASNGNIQQQKESNEERSLSREEIQAAVFLSLMNLSERMTLASIQGFYSILNTQPPTPASSAASSSTQLPPIDPRSANKNSSNSSSMPQSCLLCNQAKGNLRKTCECILQSDTVLNKQGLSKNLISENNNENSNNLLNANPFNSAKGSSQHPATVASGQVFGRKSPNNLSSLSSDVNTSNVDISGNTSTSDALRVHGLWHYRLQQHRKAQAQQQFACEQNSTEQCNSLNQLYGKTISSIQPTIVSSTYAMSSKLSSLATILTPPVILPISTAGTSQLAAHKCSTCLPAISSIMMSSSVSLSGESKNISAYLTKHRSSDTTISFKTDLQTSRDTSPPPPLPPRNVTCSNSNSSTKAVEAEHNLTANKSKLNPPPLPPRLQ